MCYLGNPVLIPVYSKDDIVRRLVTPMNAAIWRKNAQIICDLLAAGFDECAETYVTNDMIDIANEYPELVKKIISNKKGSLLEVNFFCAMIYANSSIAEQFFVENLINTEYLEHAKKIILKSVCKKGSITLFSLIQEAWYLDVSNLCLDYSCENPKLFLHLLSLGIKCPAEYFPRLLSKIPIAMLDHYLEKNPDVSKLDSKECLKSASLNNNDLVFLKLVAAGMDPLVSTKIFTSLVQRNKIELARYCLNRGFKFSNLECNVIYTDLIFSKSCLDFLILQNLEIDKDQLLFSQKISAFYNLIRYGGSIEQIKFAFKLGFDPASKPEEYDAEIVNKKLNVFLFRFGFANLLDAIFKSRNIEIFELTRSFFTMLNRNGLEKSFLTLDEYFARWNKIIVKSKKENFAISPHPKRRTGRSYLVKSV